MRKFFIIALLVAACAFAQTEIDWWVFDGGGGVRQISAGDTLWASISQPLIGLRDAAPTQLSAGYLYGVAELLFIEEVKPERDEDGKPIYRPFEFGIKSISPNPFNSACQIEFEVEDDSPVTFEFFDILGRLADTPIAGERMAPGKYVMSWGGDLPTGTYFARLSSGGRSVVQRVVYLK